MIEIYVDTSRVDVALAAVSGTGWMRGPMEGSLALIIGGMAAYPPQPSRSTYRRTGTLGRRWTSQVHQSSDGLSGEAGNNTSYGPYVQDSERQAAHMVHWQTDDQVAIEVLPESIALFEEAATGAFGE